MPFPQYKEVPNNPIPNNYRSSYNTVTKQTSIDSTAYPSNGLTEIKGAVPFGFHETNSLEDKLTGDTRVFGALTTINNT